MNKNEGKTLPSVNKKLNTIEFIAAQISLFLWRFPLLAVFVYSMIMLLLVLI